MAFTEFYVDNATGANINAGDNKSVVTSTNGAWSTVTNIFTATSGTPFSGVSVGDFASLYSDGGTVSAYVARVTAVGGGGLTLTLSSTAKSGTAPTTAGVGISCTVGGKWAGPSGSTAFPFTFVQATMTDSAGDYPRVNFKTGTTYSITSAITHANAGPMRFQGYTSSAGDGGQATIDGGTNAIVILTVSVSNVDLEDLIFSNNGSTGTNAGLAISGSKCHLKRCVVNNVRGNGFAITGTSVCLSECEAYTCNTSQTVTTGGFLLNAAGVVALRCISHTNNSGASANVDGFDVQASGIILINCISDSNSGKGVNANSGQTLVMVGCDIYNNSGDGVNLGSATASFAHIENCNFVKNGGWGINSSGASNRNGAVVNCGFGVGTQANTSGNVNTNTGAILVSGSVSYATGVTPWSAPTTGDFRITLGAAKAAGRGAFTETAASYTGTIAYPDIGAGQASDTAGGGLLRNPPMTGGMT